MSILIDEIQLNSFFGNVQKDKEIKQSPKEKNSLPYQLSIVQGYEKTEFLKCKERQEQILDEDFYHNQGSKKINGRSIFGQDSPLNYVQDGNIFFKIKSPKSQIKEVYQINLVESVVKQSKYFCIKITFQRNQQLLRVSSAALRVNLLYVFNYISWMKKSSFFEPTMTINMNNGLLQLKMPFFLVRNDGFGKYNGEICRICRQLIFKGLKMVKAYNKINLSKICQLGNLQPQNQSRSDNMKRFKSSCGNFITSKQAQSMRCLKNSDFHLQNISKHLRMSTLNIAISRKIQTAFDLQFKLEDAFKDKQNQNSSIKIESLNLFYFDLQSECEKYRKMKYQITPEDEQLFNRIVTVPQPRQPKQLGENKFLFNYIQPKYKKVGGNQLQIYHEGGFSRISICQMLFKYVENDFFSHEKKQQKGDFDEQSMDIIQKLKKQKNSNVVLTLNPKKSPMDFQSFKKNYKSPQIKKKNLQLMLLQYQRYVDSFSQQMISDSKIIDPDKDRLVKKWLAVKQPKKQQHRKKIQHELQIVKRFKCASSGYLLKYYISNDPDFSLKNELLMDATSQPSLAEHLFLSRSTISFQSKLIYLTQISHALRFLKNYKIVHMDLNPRNILVMRKQNLVKLVDFGQAYNQQVCKKQEQGFCYRPGYTLPYSPPEVPEFYKQMRQKQSQSLEAMKRFQKAVSFNYKQDAFSLGIIIFQVIFQRSPFEGISHLRLKQVYALKQYLKKLYFAPQITCMYGNIQIMNCLISLIIKCIDPCASRRVEPTWAAVILREIMIYCLQFI